MMKLSSRTRSEIFWPRVRPVLRKWLKISAHESEYSIDSSEDDDLDEDTFSEIPEEVPRLRRRNSETFRAQYIDRKDIRHVSLSYSTLGHRICVGTWNVGGKAPPDELDIDEWLDNTEPADVYVLGLQEIVPLNVGNIFGPENSRPVFKWENIIRESLNRIHPERKLKSFSNPPSPSKFKPSDDALDIEDELYHDTDSDCGEEVHPLENSGSYEFIDKSVVGDGLTVESIVSNGNASVAANLTEDLLKQFSSPRKLDSSQCFKSGLSEEDEEKTVQFSNKLSRALSGNERIGLSWPEPPMNLLAQHVFERTCSFGLRSAKSFKSSKSFKMCSSFKSAMNEDCSNISNISTITELDLEKLIRRRRRPQYVRIVSKQMVGVFVTIWVRRGLRKHIKNLKVSKVGVGVMGYIGNKGSVSVSMSIYQTPFCFICTHLTSGEKEGDELKRNADVYEIHRRTQFNPSDGLDFPKNIHDHEKIIWLGDLNYRIDLPYEQTLQLISKKQWSKLLDRDQLTRELQEGRVFEGWFEGSLDFPPTYKYEMNSEKYCGEDPKAGRRNPAWCDRILSFGHGIELQSYRRAELKLSDHRPVTATYVVEVENLCPRKLQRALTFTDAEIGTQEMVANAAFSHLRPDEDTSYWRPDTQLQ